ncbi:MAG: hypothetical protein IJU73_03655 [Ruminococcus sp.]|nr:hypothetical protein [Ruminococcus sp.]
MPSDSLEQQAMDRVARMYSSFDRRAPDRPRNKPEPRPEHKPEPQPEHKPEPQPEKPVAPAEKPEKRGGLLEYLMKDKEQSMIMLLLVILMKDGADMNLILALIYLII